MLGNDLFGFNCIEDKKRRHYSGCAKVEVASSNESVVEKLSSDKCIKCSTIKEEETYNFLLDRTYLRFQF